MPTVFNVTVLCTHAAPDESSANGLYFGFAPGSSTDYWGKIDRCMNAETTDCSYVVHAQGAPRAPVKDTSIINTAFSCWTDSGGFDGGWSCDVYVTYCYTKIL